MCVGVYESVAIALCAVLKTSMGKVVQLSVCSSVHIYSVSVNVSVCINACMSECMPTEECICDHAWVCLPSGRNP